MASTTIIVMGVSGSGKTLVGQHLAAALGRTFVDADDFHSPDNIRKMANGMPLSDRDREVWLDDLAALLRDKPGIVLACSALKRSYRDHLRGADNQLVFLYLEGDFELIWSRLMARNNHYFKGQDMLRNQFEQLEVPKPEEAFHIDVSRSPEEVVAACLQSIRSIA